MRSQKISSEPLIGQMSQHLMPIGCLMLTEAIRNLRETLASRRARQEALTQADSRQPSSCISWRLTLKDVLGWRMVSTAAVTVDTVLASRALSSTWGRPVRGLSSTSTAALGRENKTHTDKPKPKSKIQV